jgi:hypothetical protein
MSTTSSIENKGSGWTTQLEHMIEREHEQAMHLYVYNFFVLRLNIHKTLINLRNLKLL